MRARGRKREKRRRRNRRRRRERERDRRMRGMGEKYPAHAPALKNKCGAWQGSRQRVGRGRLWVRVRVRV